MGFIQLNEDFLFIEPLNDTVAITGHPHRVYRQKRSVEDKGSEKSAVHSHYCGVIPGNAFSKNSLTKYTMWDEFFQTCPPQLSVSSADENYVFVCDLFLLVIIKCISEFSFLWSMITILYQRMETKKGLQIHM